MLQKINEMIGNFGIPGEFVGYKMFKSGHINTTCMVTMNDNGVEKNYVLQKINKNVFKKPAEVMDNIAGVTSFVKGKIEAEGENSDRRVLNFLQAPNGQYFSIDGNGDYWRIYDYIDRSITFDGVDDLRVLEETGKAFGEFQNYLAEYPSADLHETIPDFHNTPKRYDTFRSVIEKNPAKRVAGVTKEIKEYMALEPMISQMQQMLDRGELPLRVTHNDTKCNNVLFDENTRDHLCVIDLDTVMPGLVGFDFGDAMRFASNTSAEDETDLDQVSIDLDKFRAFTKGFVSEVGDSLTENEKRTLALGAITMTGECGLRFLTDYLDGDNYFGIGYPTHNLDRARCQLKLAQDMIANYDRMQTIVAECVRECPKSKRQ